MMNLKTFLGLMAAVLALLLFIPKAHATDYAIGGGIWVAPDYEGSSDYKMVPMAA